MKRLNIKNYALLEKAANKKVYKERLNDKGEEVGIELRGMLTTFDVQNENGQVFEKNSYDRSVESYFVNNNLNVPVKLLHNETDIRHMIGVVEKMENNEKGIVIDVFIPKFAYYYNLTKGWLDLGVLQGFSNHGFSSDYVENENGLLIKDFDLINVAIVDTPADAAGFEMSNTSFVGFKDKIEDKKNNEKNKKNHFMYPISFLSSMSLSMVYSK